MLHISRANLFYGSVVAFGSICVLSGASINLYATTSFFLNENSNTYVTPQAVMGLTSAANETQLLPKNESLSTQSYSQATFVSEVPTNPREDFQVDIRIINIQNGVLQAKQINNNNHAQFLKPIKKTDDVISYLVDVSALEDGGYFLEFSANRNYDTSNQLVMNGPRFSIASQASTAAEVPTDDGILAVYDRNQNELPDSSITPKPTLEMKISASNSIEVDDSMRLELNSSVRARNVSIYALDQFNKKKFLTTAREVGSRSWVAVISGRSLPPGNYRLYAEAGVSDVNVVSNEIPITINPGLNLADEVPNPDANMQISRDELTSIPSNKNEMDSQISRREEVIIRDNVEERIVPEQIRTNPSIDINRNESSNSFPSSGRIIPAPEISDIIRTLLKEKELVISQEINRYVSTLNFSESRDADAEVKLVHALASMVISDSQLKAVSNLVMQRLETDLRTLLNRAILLEQRIQAFDIEAGLLSDVEQPAFSGDDAILANAQSPREFSQIREDIFTIEAVNPVISTSTVPIENDRVVKTEIVGRSLPNTFVTIYIFSSPVVVSVKTAADGTFRYVYEREIEDGEHEVYVALTDEQGTIVAKSRPFRFIKEAEAFTPISDSEDIVPIAMTTERNPFNPYIVIIAMSLLATGLLVLLFAIHMRRKDQFTISHA